MDDPCTVRPPAQTRRALCLDCNYPLRELTTYRCPECGRSFDPTRPATMNTSGRAFGAWSRRWLQGMGHGPFLGVLAPLIAAEFWLRRYPVPAGGSLPQRLAWTWGALVVVWVAAQLIPLYLESLWQPPRALCKRWDRRAMIFPLTVACVWVVIALDGPFWVNWWVTRPAAERMAREILDGAVKRSYPDRQLGLWELRNWYLLPDQVGCTLGPPGRCLGLIYAPGGKSGELRSLGGGWYLSTFCADDIGRRHDVEQRLLEALAQGHPMAGRAVPALVDFLAEPYLDIWSETPVGGYRAPDSFDRRERFYTRGSTQQIVRPDMRALLRLGTPALPELTRALETRDARQRLAALGTLSLMDPPPVGVAPEVAKRLSDPEHLVREVAAFLLGRMGPAARGQVPALWSRLTDEDAWVRYNVAIALGRIGVPGRGRDLLAAARREATTVPTTMPAKSVALGGLELNWHELPAQVRARHIVALELVRAAGPEAGSLTRELAELARDLRRTGVLPGDDRDRQERLVGACLEMLRKAGATGPEVVVLLRDLLRETQDPLVAQAVQTMNPGDAPSVAWLLAEFEGARRAWLAAEPSGPASWQSIARGEALAQLLRILNPDNERVRTMLLEDAAGQEREPLRRNWAKRIAAILPTSAPETPEGLAERLAYPGELDPLPLVRKVGALGARGAAAAEALARTAQRHRENTELRVACLDILERLGPAAYRAIPILQEILWRDRDNWNPGTARVAAVLAAIGPEPPEAYARRVGAALNSRAAFRWSPEELATWPTGSRRAVIRKILGGLDRLPGGIPPEEVCQFLRMAADEADEAIPALGRMLESDIHGNFPAEPAGEALAEIGRTYPTQVLAEVRVVLSRKRLRPESYRYAISALAHTGPEGAKMVADLLAEHLAQSGSVPPYVVEKELEILLSQSPEAEPYWPLIVQACSKSSGDNMLLRRVLAVAAQRGPREDVVVFLTRVLNDPEPAMRRRGIATLAAMGPQAKAALGALEKHRWGDIDEDVRAAATDACAAIGGPSTRPGAPTRPAVP